MGNINTFAIWERKVDNEYVLVRELNSGDKRKRAIIEFKYFILKEIRSKKNKNKSMYLYCGRMRVAKCVVDRYVTGKVIRLVLTSRFSIYLDIFEKIDDVSNGHRYRMGSVRELSEGYKSVRKDKYCLIYEDKSRFDEEFVLVDGGTSM